MLGSLFYNCWAALIAFTIYFCFQVTDSFVQPIPVLVFSFIIAIVAFLLMFPIRFLLGYVFYTPSEVAFQAMEQELGSEQMNPSNNASSPQKNHSTVEFEDESTEDIAKVVRTMMEREGSV